MSDVLAALQAALLEAELATRTKLDGAVATYIPRLATVEPDQFALAVCTIGGEVAWVGDCEAQFSLQSTSKPFAYAAALALLGRDAVRERVGVEPTGRAFDSFVRLEAGTQRPHNPMINVGAIAIAAILQAQYAAAPIGELLRQLSAFAGRDLQVDAETYLGERDTGHINRAIAYLLRHHGAFTVDVDSVLDLYFQQCAVEGTCRDLAVMAATLANGGVHPKSQMQVVSPLVARDVVAVMSTCGLYDAAGTFFYEVGLPAKSGVSGAIFAVVPGRLGIAAWSPRLDTRGNPLRGVAAIRSVAKALDLHIFAPKAEPPIRVPDPLPTEAELTALVQELSPDGKLGIAIVGLDGREVAAGNASSFAIQATANALAHALALERLGEDAIRGMVGVEPSGNAFHGVFLDAERNRPYNPLGNAGAIALASLVPGKSIAERVSAQLRELARLAGVPRLEVDAVVLHAERVGGDRNRAIASMLRAHDVIRDVDAALDVYFHQCSIRVTTAHLARMAGVLANGGVDPKSGERLLRADVVQQVLSVMYTCGLHDESGRFAFDVGMPAKSGISGNILAVAPGRMGIAVFAPDVNERGTSLLGRIALVKMAERYALSVFLAESPHSAE